MSTASPTASADELVSTTRRTQQDWSRLSVRDRLRPVHRLRQLLAAECDALCDAVERDTGKPPVESLGGDLLPLAEACRFLGREAAGLLRPRSVSRGLRPLWLWGQSDKVYRRPRGVVGIIGTWNYPLFLNGVQIVQATTAGNGVVWKPSEVAPGSAALLHALLLRAGFPEGLVARMEASRDGGPALVESSVDHVVFTGGADTGRRVARRLAERLVSSTLELSGCDAQFVFPDADVGMAASAAWFGATLNRGQTCLAVRRVFVQRPVYTEFCLALRTRAAGARPVRLTLPAQAAQAERLARDAVAAGASRVCGPTNHEPLGDGYFPPTALLDARPEMAVCREASFAPLLAVIPFEDVGDAVAMESQCPYALGASVFTARPPRAEALAARLRCGSVTVNDVVAPTAHPATPFGGRGDSGWGVTQGAEGLLEMTVPQVVSHRAGRFRPHYDLAAGRDAAGQRELLRGLLEAGHGASLRQRLGGWRRVVAAARGISR